MSCFIDAKPILLRKFNLLFGSMKFDVGKTQGNRFYVPANELAFSGL